MAAGVAAAAGEQATESLKSSTSSKLSLKAAEGQAASLNLGTGSSVYKIGVTAGGVFEIALDEKALMEVDSSGKVTFRTATVSSQALSVSSMTIRGVPQWSLVTQEIFTPTQGSGWSLNQKVTCGDVTILGQYPTPPPDDTAITTDVNFTKSFNVERAHTKIRVTGTVHFIDDWQGETAYLKVDGHYVWTQSHSEKNSKSSVNVCGKLLYPESRFSVSIDATIPHTAASLKVVFGSTLRSDQAMFGVSSFAIYTI
ncbi:hypothetical protein AAMO2058_000456900 [Amorphochlora amoebiformis]